MTQAVRIMFSHFHPQRKTSAASDFLQLFSFGFYLIGQKYGGSCTHTETALCVCVCAYVWEVHIHICTLTHTYRRTKMVVKKKNWTQIWPEATCNYNFVHEISLLVFPFPATNHMDKGRLGKNQSPLAVLGGSSIKHNPVHYALKKL